MDLTQLPGVIGCIVLADIMGDIPWLLDRLGKIGLPVAVFDETGNVPVEAGTVLPYPLLHFKAGFTPTAATAVAKYLIGTGHRRIAYLSHCHWNAWSKVRYYGLVETFSAEGMPGAVRLFDPGPEMIEYYDYGREGNGQVVPPQMEPVNRWEKRLDEVKSSIPPTISHFYKGARNVLADLRRCEALWCAMSPLFQKALSERSITAWVMCSDDLAYLAMYFCGQEGVNIPGRVSLVGFDDLPDSFKKDLTTYNFNLDGVAYRMLSFILQSQKHHAENMVWSIEIEGLILQRGTSGTPGGTQ